MRFIVMSVVFLLVIAGAIGGTIYLVGKNAKSGEKAEGTEVRQVVAPAPAKPAGPPEPTTRPAPRPTHMRVLVASRAISAYGAIDIADVSNNGQLSTVDIPRASIAAGTTLFEVPYEAPEKVMSRILGRVAKRNIPAGSPLMEAYLYSGDTRAGIVAAIPPGKRAMIIDSARLPGVHNLRAGDHVDLVAAIPVDMKEVNKVNNARKENVVTAPGAIAAPVWQNPENIASPVREAEVRVLVDNGLLVTPARKPTAGAPLAALGKGGTAGMSGSLDGLTATGQPANPKAAAAPPVVDEVIIVMLPEEVPLVTQALAIGAQIIVIPRSGTSETEEQGRTIPIKSKATTGETDKFVVEEVVGSKKTTVVFPAKTETKGN